ncbi:unnamed protein product, partial [Iphiclides podalirius]
MRTLLLLSLFVFTICVSIAAPQSRLQLSSDAEGKPYVEEVVVESVLHVRSPSIARNSRANTKTNLQNGSKITENKIV